MSLESLFGQDGQMPRLIAPSADTPAEVDRAFRAYSSRARLDIVHVLSARGAMTMRALAEALGASYETMRSAVGQLEELGYVIKQLPSEGRNARFAVDDELVKNDLARLVEYLSGGARA